MSLFKNLKSDGLEETEDRLGGYKVFESDIYVGTIKQAYAGQSKDGAHNVSLIVDLDGSEYRETIYITNKKGENWFTKQDDPKRKIPLPGFTTIDDICQIAAGKALADMDTEDKVVKVYDPDVKKEVPKSVPTLVELIGQPIALGIIKILENKNKKEGGEYVPTEETREVNTIDKVFHPTMKLTVVEARQGKEEAVFWGNWIERRKGQTQDRRKVKEGQAGAAGAAGAPRAGRTPAGPPMANGAAAPARKSLFGGAKAN